jgi:hypothetical protein
MDEAFEATHTHLACHVQYVCTTYKVQYGISFPDSQPLFSKPPAGKEEKTRNDKPPTPQTVNSNEPFDTNK